ncbi:protein mab-21-like 3 isoform X3 [Ambystoma mexicanum]|uniref:protein mab-21-like 3 isoform X3 n=1 Tax=Ambystoma mexicanum TaxID=8296 RepID=UPI0037E78949
MCGRRGRSAMKDFSEEDLDHYLHNKVDLRRRRVSKMVEEVQKVIQQLTHEISLKDSRFQSISNSGIHNDNIKDSPDLVAKWSALLSGKRVLHPSIQVLSPAQFLITVPLRGLAGFRHRKARRWRYYSLSGTKLLSPVMEPEKLHQWLEAEQFPKTSRPWHESDVNVEGDLIPAKVIRVFRDLLERSIASCKLSDKVAMLETLGPVVRVAVETSEHQVEVELVPTVEIPTCWSKKSRWPRFLKRWPSKEKVRCVKMLLLWSCEKYPRAKDWKNFKKCFLRLFRKLRKCVSQHFLKHYFVRGTNLLKYSNSTELDLMVQKMDEFSTNPAKYIR